MLHAKDFLHEIAANPDDESARLIYADWLEDQGDPRAAFVRVQCELASQKLPDERTLPLRAAEVRLLSAHKSEWLAGIRDYGVIDAKFVAGVISAIEININDFLNHAPTLFDMAPTIHHLKLQGIKRKAARDSFAKLMRCRQFQRIRELDLSGNRTGAFGTPQNGSTFSQLESLDLSNNGLRDQAIDALTLGNGFERLTRLAAAGNLLTRRGAQYLAASAIAPRLTHLDLSRNLLRGAGMMAIVSSPSFSNLRHLDMAGTSLSEDVALALATSPHFSQLASVRVSWLWGRAQRVLQERFGIGLTLC